MVGIRIIFISEDETSCNGSIIKNFYVSSWPGKKVFLALWKTLKRSDPVRIARYEFLHQPLKLSSCHKV